MDIRGNCTVNIIQHGIIEQETTVEFDATNIHIPDLIPIEDTEDDNCESPSILTVINGVLYCEHPCSIDEVK